jgi:hypothetical protein
MKLFEIDWRDFFARLEVWERLSCEARQAFANTYPGHPEPVANFNGDERLLVEAGFMVFEADGTKLGLLKECQPFGRVVRAMTRIDVLGEPRADVFNQYVGENFSRDEREELSGEVSFGAHRCLWEQATSVGWLEAFLAAKEQPGAKRAKRGATWEPQHVPSWLSLPKAAARAPAPVPWSAVQDVIRHFAAWPGPVPMKELPARLPGIPMETLAAAIQVGLERLVLFPAMRRADMTPMLGLWPSTVARLQRPKLHSPAPVQPETTFQVAVALEDMTAALVAATARPLRLRQQDLSLFAKAEQEIAANLMVLPDWMSTISPAEPAGRVRVAVDWLRSMGFLRARAAKGEPPRLEATRRASAWMGQPAKDRLKVVLDDMRRLPPGKRPKRAIPAWEVDLDDDAGDEGHNESYHEYYGKRPLLPFTVELPGQQDSTDELAGAVAEAFASVPGDQFVPLAEFVAWRSQEHNPLIKWYSGERQGTVRFGYRTLPPTVENIEATWDRLLTQFFCYRLLPLGGVRAGVFGQDGICFTLTPAGRYLLGLADDFDYGHEQEPKGQVVVQPNFDVVFLGPSPLAEADLARIAERRGRGTGAMFQITKKSILAAAGVGMTAEQTLDVLQGISSKPLPANVTREIQGWFDQCRQITVRPAVLIECPDADTAARVVSAGGQRASLLTDTVVELADKAARTELVRKLHGMGIFVDRRGTGPVDKDEPRTRRGRGR